MVTPDEAVSGTRRRTTSEGQYQNIHEDSHAHSGAVRSPGQCASPEFVNTITLNPGGRPKEVVFQEYVPLPTGTQYN